jgi:arylsulfatase A-like enzyme
MPSYLKDLGYSTHMLGKWNIGHCNSKYLPHERGFDHFLGYVGPGHGYMEHDFDYEGGHVNFSFSFLFIFICC